MRESNRLKAWLRHYEEDAGGLDFDQWIANEHPLWTLVVTYRIEGVGILPSYTETQELAPGASQFLYCNSTDPAPGRYIGYTILHVRRKDEDV